jgi:1,4-dihydroxy-2-naphthoate polyprenyltransferase
MSSDPAYLPVPSSRIGLWLYALRAPFLTASAIPVAIGSCAAVWTTGHFALGRFLAALGGVVSLHLGANLANDYFDYTSGCDDLNPQPTPFSGGSRVIQRGLISSRAIVAAFCSLYAVAAALGLYLNSVVPGNRVLWLGLAGLLGGFFYTAGPLRLSYRGAGEAIVFALFGPLAVAGGYLVQTGRLGGYPVVAALPAGLLVLAILLVNEVLDVEADARAGKRTLVVLLGKRRGYYLYLAAYACAYLAVAVAVVLRVYPPVAAVAALPAVAAARRLRPDRALGNRPSTIDASRLTVMSHVVTGCAIAIALLVGRSL